MPPWGRLIIERCYLPPPPINRGAPLHLSNPIHSPPPLLSSLLPWFPLFGVELVRLEVLPPSTRHRAAGFPVRNLLLLLPLLDRSPEDVCTLYVYKTMEVPYFRYFFIVELYVYSTLRSASSRLLQHRSSANEKKLSVFKGMISDLSLLLTST